MNRMKTLCAVLLCGALLALAGLWLNHDIGLPASRLEQDFRNKQAIAPSWEITGQTSGQLAAFIACDAEGSDHTVSVYINRPGLSFGYFFRGGGSLSMVERSIVAFEVEGCPERAFISLNQQRAARLEVDDGTGVQTTPLDADAPFALVLPVNAGELAFYDEAGQPVEFLVQPL